MNLYTLIQLEPAEKKTHPGDQLLPGGEIPAEHTIHLNKNQKAIIHNAIMRWYHNEPECLTEEYRTQRKRVIQQLQESSYQFIFEFHTGDPISLDCYQKDNKALYASLKKACKKMGINIVRYESI